MDNREKIQQEINECNRILEINKSITERNDFIENEKIDFENKLKNLIEEYNNLGDNIS